MDFNPAGKAKLQYIDGSDEDDCGVAPFFDSDYNVSSDEGM